ncbi:MAG: hypothetical protein ABI488_15400 [Polyangiaceae bacterium]
MDAPLELVRLVGQNEQYLCWLTGAGAMMGAPTFVSITSVLPLTGDVASSIWPRASQPAAA